MAPSSPFADFAAVADAVAATSSKLRKRDLLAEYLRGLPPDDLPIAATFFAGRPLPGAQDRLGLGWVQQSQALAAASGADASALNAAYLRHSDLGDAAADLLAGHQPSGPPLTVAEVDGAFRAMSEAAGADARVAEMARLLGARHARGGALRRAGSRRARCESGCARGCWRRPSRPPSSAPSPTCAAR